MRCPFCGQDEDKVIESRTVGEGVTIRRRRQCEACSQRFTSYERVEREELMIIKKDGRREPFDREKIISGITRACEKRPVSMDEINQLVDDIEKELYTGMPREMPSQEIGRLVIEKLHGLDEVAYVRFASVYRQFREVEDFVREINRYLKGKSTEK